MNTKTLTALIAILGTLTVLYTQVDLKPEVSAFEQWKGKFNIKYDSAFQHAYREKLFL